ncbi:MAG: hypothetical protein NC225_06800 [Clostridium sp.]|nr:hypothetical protein [Clostridium sp.]MCM1459199.1 hypothetical protein [Bacteroides sp.]
MESIHFGKNLIYVFFCSFIFYVIVNVIISVLLKNSTGVGCKKDGIDYKSDNVKDMGQTLVIIICNILVLHYIIKNQIKVIMIIFVMVILVLAMVLILYSIWSFVQDVFIKSYDFILTKEKERTLFFAGCFSGGGFWFIKYLNDKSIVVQSVLLELPFALKDFILILVLILLYYLNIFFISSFFVLSLHNIIIFINSQMGKKGGKQKKNRKKRHKKKIKNFSAKKVKILKFNKTKIGYHICHIIHILGEIVFFIIDSLFQWMRILVYLIIKFPFIVARGIFRKLISRLSGDQGKTIIFLSRLSLLVSCIVVYIIDKYNCIFSAQGSESYEFLCSVILIPLVITQLADLKNRKNILVENTQHDVKNEK